MGFDLFGKKRRAHGDQTHNRRRIFAERALLYTSAVLVADPIFRANPRLSPSLTGSTHVARRICEVDVWPVEYTIGARHAIEAQSHMLRALQYAGLLEVLTSYHTFNDILARLIEPSFEEAAVIALLKDIEAEALLLKNAAVPHSHEVN